MMSIYLKVSEYLLLSLVVSFENPFDEIVSVFLPLESKTSILYVNISFTGNLFLDSVEVAANLVGIYMFKINNRNILNIFYTLFYCFYC